MTKDRGSVAALPITNFMSNNLNYKNYEKEK